MPADMQAELSAANAKDSLSRDHASTALNAATTSGALDTVWCLLGPGLGSSPSGKIARA